MQEVPLPGQPPRFEIPGWRDQYGVVAGITGRGSAADPFDLGLSSRTPVGEVMGRWRALRASEPGFSAWVLGHQVHGNRVVWHEGGLRPGWTLIEGVDGHGTAEPGLLLLATVADCIPVYLVDPGRRAVALLHAGWRGIAARILEQGIGALCQHSKSSPADLVMHCGVGICGSCYEVGSEVLARLGVERAGEPASHVDLRAQLVERGRGLGVSAISTSQWCSSHHPDQFFSHRASHGADGRMVAYLGYPSPAIPA